MSKESLKYNRSINPRTLNLQWCQSGEPPKLKEKIILLGSEGSKFLLLCQPTTQSGPSAGIMQISFSVVKVMGVNCSYSTVGPR